MHDRKDSRSGRDARDPSRRKRSRSHDRAQDHSRVGDRDSERRHRDRERSERPREGHRDKHRRIESSDGRPSVEPQQSEAAELNQREQDDIDRRHQRALAWQKLQAEKQPAQVCGSPGSSAKRKANKI